MRKSKSQGLGRRYLRGSLSSLNSYRLKTENAAAAAAVFGPKKIERGAMDDPQRSA